MEIHLDFLQKITVGYSTVKYLLLSFLLVKMFMGGEVARQPWQT